MWGLLNHFEEYVDYQPTLKMIVNYQGTLDYINQKPTKNIVRIIRFTFWRRNELAYLEDEIAHLRVLGGPSLEAVEVVRGQEEETFLWNSYECLCRANGNVSVELMWMLTQNESSRDSPTRFVDFQFCHNGSPPTRYTNAFRIWGDICNVRLTLSYYS